LLPQILELIDEVIPNRAQVCDLFAGSGTVSFALSAERPVVSVDIQEYSRVLCSAMLGWHRMTEEEIECFQGAVGESPLRSALERATAELVAYEEASLDLASQGEPEAICDVLEGGSIISTELGVAEAKSHDLKGALESAVSHLREEKLADGPKAVVTRYFGGVYFSYKQARELDIALDIAHGSAPHLRDILVASILSVASDLVNTVGKQFAQPILPRAADGLPKKHLVHKIEQDRTAGVSGELRRALDRFAGLPVPSGVNKVVRADYKDALASEVEGVGGFYADPPYTRDHYSRYYHVLETMACHDVPNIASMRKGNVSKLSRGLYRLDRHQSPFCIKSQAPGAFEELFAGVNKLQVPLILSYSPYATELRERPRLLKVDDLITLAKRHFSVVEERSAGRIAHNKLNAVKHNTHSSYTAELFLVCRP
jgi:adenine-specific DNA methylase